MDYSWAEEMGQSLDEFLKQTEPSVVTVEVPAQEIVNTVNNTGKNMGVADRFFVGPNNDPRDWTEERLRKMKNLYAGPGMYAPDNQRAADTANAIAGEIVRRNAIKDMFYEAPGGGIDLSARPDPFPRVLTDNVSTPRNFFYEPPGGGIDLSGVSNTPTVVPKDSADGLIKKALAYASTNLDTGGRGFGWGGGTLAATGLGLGLLNNAQGDGLLSNLIQTGVGLGTGALVGGALPGAKNNLVKSGIVGVSALAGNTLMGALTNLLGFDQKDEQELYRQALNNAGGYQVPQQQMAYQVQQPTVYY